MSGYCITHKVNGIRVVREDDCIFVADITNLAHTMMYEIGFKCPLTIEEQMEVIEKKQTFPFVHSIDPTLKVGINGLTDRILEIEVDVRGVIEKTQFLVFELLSRSDEKRRVLSLVLDFIRNSYSKG